MPTAPSSMIAAINASDEFAAKIVDFLRVESQASGIDDIQLLTAMAMAVAATACVLLRKDEEDVSRALTYANHVARLQAASLLLNDKKAGTQPS